MHSWSTSKADVKHDKAACGLQPSRCSGHTSTRGARSLKQAESKRQKHQIGGHFTVSTMCDKGIWTGSLWGLLQPERLCKTRQLDHQVQTPSAVHMHSWTIILTDVPILTDVAEATVMHASSDSWVPDNVNQPVFCIAADIPFIVMIIVSSTADLYGCLCAFGSRANNAFISESVGA